MELILYSNSDRFYVDALAELLKTEGATFDFVLCKDEVPFTTFKALSGNRKPQDIVIVDQKVSGFMSMLQNGVFVPPFRQEVNSGQYL